MASSEAGTERIWQAPGRFNGYTIRGLMALGRTLLFTAPTQADTSGVATDFEPHILSVFNRESDDEPVTLDEVDLDAGEDRATEPAGTVDEAGLPLSRSTGRQSSQS